MADISELSVGDEVRIREWDDMEREFGNDGGVIPCGSHVFVPKMKDICNRRFMISKIGGTYSRDIIEGHSTGWIITAAMVELVNTYFFEETDSLSQFINNIKVARKE